MNRVQSEQIRKLIYSLTIPVKFHIRISTIQLEYRALSLEKITSVLELCDWTHCYYLPSFWFPPENKEVPHETPVKAV